MSTTVFPEGYIPCSEEATLVGVDGNAYGIMGYVKKELRKAGNPPEVVKTYQDEAMSGDYGHLLQTSISYLEGKP